MTDIKEKFIRFRSKSAAGKKKKKPLNLLCVLNKYNVLGSLRSHNLLPSVTYKTNINGS